jgi:hypothetical protein
LRKITMPYLETPGSNNNKNNELSFHLQVFK